ncbi:hypothetical protein EDC94DRAFT_518383, partial [Helicostylum pulchrum]
LGKIRSGIAESSNSAISFLKMLVTFRVTFLQDAVFMKLKYPRHPIFVNPLFDELFIQFGSDLQAAVIENEGNNPVNMRLRTAVPLIDQRLETMQKKFDNENTLRNTQKQNILKQLSDISTGRAPLNINVHIPGDGRQPPTVTTDFISLIVPATNVDTFNESTVSGSTNVITLSATTPAIRSRSTSIVTYRFAKALTLPILWCEWFDGLGGNYSIIEMNRLEPNWYKKDQKSYYDRRNRIIKRIRDYARQKFISDEAALQKAEQHRQDYKYSLDYLGKNIRFLYGF